MAAFSAKYAKIRFNGPDSNAGNINVGDYFLAAKWSVNTTTDRIDVTTFESNGDADYLSGFTTAEINFEAFWDSDVNVHASPRNVYAGKIIKNVYLYLSQPTGGKTNGPASPLGASTWFFFPRMLVLSVMTEAEVRGALRFTINAVNKGRFFYPGEGYNASGVSTATDEAF